MKLSVLFTTYNDGGILTRALAPILEDTAADEVVVVVDGSDDGTYEMLEDRARHEPRLRPFFIANRGRAGAWQYGLQQVSNDVVLLLDADVVAWPGLVKGHATWHSGGHRLVVGYMPVQAEPGAATFNTEEYARLYEQRCESYESDPAQILHGLWAGNVSLPVACLDRIGGLDAGLRLRYYDDYELGLRLQQCQLEPIFDRVLRADHAFSQSLAGYLRSGRSFGHDMLLIETAHQLRGDTTYTPTKSVRTRVLDAICEPAPASLLTAIGRLIVDLAGRQPSPALQLYVARRLWRFHARIGRKEAAAHLTSAADGSALSRAGLG